MSTRRRLNPIVVITILLIAVGHRAAAQGEAPEPEPVRGFNVPVADLYECRMGARQDCQTLQDAANAGATVVRLNFAKLPLMDQDSFEIREEAFDFLRGLLNEASALGLRAVIDPHAMPGADRHTTLEADDRFWRDPAARRALLTLWRTIAYRTRAYGDTVYAFDLINEPYEVPANGQLNALYRDLVTAVRYIDSDRDVILDFYYQHYHDSVPDGYEPQPPSYYAANDRGTDGNARGTGKIRYSTHAYWPLDYTHQGIEIERGDGRVTKRDAGQRWPDDSRTSNGRPWNRTGLRARFNGVRSFSSRHGHWRMFIGEFSASACADCAWDDRADVAGELPANGGHGWLSGVVELFDDYGWSWTYHSLNSASFWDSARPERRRLHLEGLLASSPR